MDRNSRVAATPFWDRYELPTVLLGLVLYASWVALVWYHAYIPGWLLFLLGGYVVQWHFSLQHESIHAMRNWPTWLRNAFVWPPLGLWLPYPLYNRSHSTHHVNFHLTHPQRDTESYYRLAGDWQRLGRIKKALLMLNQTLACRLVFGPFVRLYKLVRREAARLLAGTSPTSDTGSCTRSASACCCTGSRRWRACRCGCTSYALRGQACRGACCAPSPSTAGATGRWNAPPSSNPTT